jgi:hypothetical protein
MASTTDRQSVALFPCSEKKFPFQDYSVDLQPREWKRGGFSTLEIKKLRQPQATRLFRQELATNDCRVLGNWADYFPSI